MNGMGSQYFLMHDLRPEMQKICRDGRGTSGKEKQLKEFFLGDVHKLGGYNEVHLHDASSLEMSTSSIQDR
jgi:hypothetical protein